MSLEYSQWDPPWLGLGLSQNRVLVWSPEDEHSAQVQLPQEPQLPSTVNRNYLKNAQMIIIMYLFLFKLISWLLSWYHIIWFTWAGLYVAIRCFLRDSWTYTSTPSWSWIIAFSSSCFGSDPTWFGTCGVRSPRAPHSINWNQKLGPYTLLLSLLNVIE